MPVKKTKSCPDQSSLDFFKMQTENISLHDEINKLRGIIADRDSVIIALEISLNETKKLVPKSENKPLFSTAVQSSPLPKVQSTPRSLLAPMSDEPKMQVLSAGLPKSTARPLAEGPQGARPQSRPQVPGPQLAKPPAGRPSADKPPVGKPPVGKPPITPPAGRPTAGRPPASRPPVARPQNSPRPQGNTVPSGASGPKKVRIYHDSNLRWSSPSQIKNAFKD